MVIESKYLGPAEASEVSVLHPLQRFGHDVSNIIINADLLELDDILFSIVSDRMVSEINLLGPLVGHKVACHVNGSLVVQEHIDWKRELCKLFQELKRQSILAGI